MTQSDNLKRTCWRYNVYSLLKHSSQVRLKESNIKVIHDSECKCKLVIKSQLALKSRNFKRTCKRSWRSEKCCIERISPLISAFHFRRTVPLLSVEWHSAECHSEKECHLEQWHWDKCYSEDLNSVEWHPEEGNSAEWHSVEQNNI